MRSVHVATFLVLISLSLLAATYQPVRDIISGMLSGSEVNVSLQPVNDISLSIILSNQTIVPGDIENMTVFAQNRGGISSAPSQITLTVYIFNGSALIQKAVYQDSLINYYPGFKRTFKSVFVAAQDGLFFVKANISFASKNFETWSAFLVLNNNATSTTPSTSPPSSSSGGGGGGGAAVSPNQTITIIQTPSMNLTYPKSVKVEQGDSVVFPIEVNNIGTSFLNNLRMFISSSIFLNFDINPKIVQRIDPSYNFRGQMNTTFLISVNAPDDVSPGEYPLDFKVLSDEIDSSGKMSVIVVPKGSLSIDDIKQRILSYGLIILDIDQQMLTASDRGINVADANTSLSQAKDDLERAKEFLNLGDYSKSKDNLDKVKSSLERATLQLATATFFVYKAPEIPWTYIIVAFVVILIAFLVFYYRRRKNRRPRLLKGTEMPKASDE